MVGALRRPRTAGDRFVWPHFASIVMFVVGSALAMSVLYGPLQSYVWMAFVSFLCTGWWIGLGIGSTDSSLVRSLGWVCRAAVLGCHALWIYLAAVFGFLLGWTVPAWLCIVVGACLVAVVATARRSRDRFHVPLVIPLGIWIAALLSGWLAEEHLLRCDDYLSLRPPVELIVPGDGRLAKCQPGEVRPSGRFPRTIWEAPDGERLVFTTQGRQAPGGIDGSVCEADVRTGVISKCVGRPLNKAQGLLDFPDRDRLLVVQWGILSPAGVSGSVLFEVPRSTPLEILNEHWFDEMFADGFFDRRTSTLHLFSDRYNGLHRVSLPGFERRSALPYEFAPGEHHYDRAIEEGVACGSHLGAAIGGDPVTLRYFAEGSYSFLDHLSVTWGCDWDPQSRKVYTTIPNLGLLARIDYDTGRVEKRWFVGPGMRSVAYDRVRQRVYFTNFLRGYVVAFDERSERVVDRWFVGRFSRWVRLTRDGSALLATGNLGIARIPLDAPNFALPASG